MKFLLSPQLLYNLLREAVPLESGLRSNDLKKTGAESSTFRGQQGRRQKASARYQIPKEERAARKVNKEVMHAGKV